MLDAIYAPVSGMLFYMTARKIYGNCKKDMGLYYRVALPKAALVLATIFGVALLRSRHAIAEIYGLVPILIAFGLYLHQEFASQRSESVSSDE